MSTLANAIQGFLTHSIGIRDKKTDDDFITKISILLQQLKGNRIKGNRKNLGDLQKAIAYQQIDVLIELLKEGIDTTQPAREAALFKSFILSAQSNISNSKRALQTLSELKEAINTVLTKVNHQKIHNKPAIFSNLFEPEDLESIEFLQSILETGDEIKDKKDAVESHNISTKEPNEVLFYGLIGAFLSQNSICLDILEYGIPHLERIRNNANFVKFMHFASKMYKFVLFGYIADYVRNRDHVELNTYIDIDVDFDIMRMGHPLYYSTMNIDPTSFIFLLNKGCNPNTSILIEDSTSKSLQETTAVELLFSKALSYLKKHFSPEEPRVILDALIWAGLKPQVHFQRQHLASILEINLPKEEQDLLVPAQNDAVAGKTFWETMNTRLERYKKNHPIVLEQGYPLSILIKQLQYFKKLNKLDPVHIKEIDEFLQSKSLHDIITTYNLLKDTPYANGISDEHSIPADWYKSHLSNIDDAIKMANWLVLSLQKLEHKLRFMINHFEYCLKLNDTIKRQSEINRREKYGLLDDAMCPPSETSTSLKTVAKPNPMLISKLAPIPSTASLVNTIVAKPIPADNPITVIKLPIVLLDLYFGIQSS